MLPCAQHLILITDRGASERVLAAWYRVLPETALSHLTVRQAEWKEDVLSTFSASPEYIQALTEIIDETISDSNTRFVTVL